MKIHPLITDSQTLADLCARLSQSPFVAVDTEFMRENTYWPELCLVQVAPQSGWHNECPEAPSKVCAVASRRMRLWRLSVAKSIR